jgi:hypothetical protein
MSGLSPVTIARFESGELIPPLFVLNIQDVLEERGIRFETCGTGPKPYLGICGPQTEPA